VTSSFSGVIGFSRSHGREPDGLDRALDRCFPGEHDDREVRVALAQALEGGQAVEPRHHDVEENEIGEGLVEPGRSPAPSSISSTR